MSYMQAGLGANMVSRAARVIAPAAPQTVAAPIPITVQVVAAPTPADQELEEDEKILGIARGDFYLGAAGLVLTLLTLIMTRDR